MKRGITIAAILSIFCLPLLSQEKKAIQSEQESAVKTENPAEKKDTASIKNIPAGSLYSDLIDIKKVYFNKRIEPAGKGDLLEVEFELVNKIDEPQDLYLFVIATFEKTGKTSSSFEAPIPEKEKLRSFVPFPEDIKNFEYTDKAGNVKLLKLPRNPKTGVDAKTGKAYHLMDKLYIRTNHLASYRNNFYYFNMVMILAFNSNGDPIYRKQYKIEGIRR
ncbi:MAG: hypothetical protein MUC95_08965 [Spirochaetes bacterium]|nr:hypothetical protein [Spirochaetota bacterium]